jgi:uncharacterized protein YdaU (DUF1376 family)
MSRTDAWMPLYIGDYLADTMHLDAQEHGAYLLLLMHQWRNGPLPDDDKALAGIARVERKVWTNVVAPVVRRFFEVVDGKLVQKRLQSERQKADKLSDTRRGVANARHAKKDQAATKDAVEGYAKPEQTGCNDDAIASANAELEHTHARVAVPSPSPSKKDSVSDETAAGAPPAPPTAAELLWSIGLPILSALTGKPPSSCRSFMGQLKKNLRDDCPKLLMILQEASGAGLADPVAWLTAATQDRRTEAAESAAARRIREQDELLFARSQRAAPVPMVGFFPPTRRLQ